MPRRKVRLQFLVNASSRKTSYHKRKKGFIKKMDELSKLCDVKTAAIIYSPYEPQPVVIPNHEEATKLLTEFKELPPMERTKRMFDQELFMRQQMGKAKERLRKLKIDNREKEMSLVMYKCLEKWEIDQNISKFEANDLNDLRLVIERQVRQIIVKQQTVNEQLPNQVEAQPAATEDLRQMTSVLERHIREVRISRKSSANVQNQVVEAQLAAMHLGPMTWGAFGEGTNTGLGQQQQWTAMELGPTTWSPFGEGTSRAVEHQGQQQQQQWDAMDALGPMTWTAFVEEASRGVEQKAQQPTAMELGPTTWSPFGEGTSTGLEQQANHQQQQWTAMEAQTIEELQQQMMQVAAQRQKQLMLFEQNQQQQIMFQQNQQQQQLFPQNPWFESIMIPPTPQTMDFMTPLLPLPPGLFGDYNSSGNGATWENNSSFRFP